MQPRHRFLPVALLIVGLAGLILIVYATRVPGGGGGDWVIDPASVAQRATVTPMPTTGSVEMPLPEDPTQTLNPTLTPTLLPPQLSAVVVGSGTHQAYVQDGDLIVIDAAGGRSVVAEMTVMPRGPWWSPNGKLLLFVTEEHDVVSYHIWDSVQDVEFHPLEMAPDFPADIVELPDRPWSPSGEQLLFRVTGEAGSAGALGYWVLDLPTGESWLAVERGDYRAARWLSDDALLVTQVREDGLADIALVAASPGVVSSTLVLTGTTGAYDISPDGAHLAAQMAFPGAEERGWLQVLALPAESEAELFVGLLDGLACHGAPLWSTNGRWIACITQTGVPDEGSCGSTLIVDVHGYSPLQTVADFSPLVWSPDGRLLAGSLCQDGARGLALADALTGELIEFAEEAILPARLSWSPGGVYLAYRLTGAEDEQETLVVWDRFSRETWPVLSSGSDSEIADLQWTADGCRLFAAERQVGPDGSGEIRTLWAVGPEFDQRWQVAPPSDSVFSEPTYCPEPILEGRRFVAFYGSPAGPGLGILGRYDISTTLELLDDQAGAYRELDPEVETLLAFHMVTTVADPFPGADGDYNHRVSHAVIQDWVDAIAPLGGWAIVDVQPGHATVATEIEMLEPLLEQPQVHLALDPEFTMAPGEVPGQRIGQMSAVDINRAQAWLDLLARRSGHRKVLIIHQFEDFMIDGKWSILHYPMVDLIWDSDGVGGSGAKIGDYQQYCNETGFEYGGFKIFYDYDSDVMTPERVMALDPLPALVIYQ